MQRLSKGIQRGETLRRVFRQRPQQRLIGGGRQCRIESRRDLDRLLIDLLQQRGAISDNRRFTRQQQISERRQTVLIARRCCRAGQLFRRGEEQLRGCPGGLFVGSSGAGENRRRCAGENRLAEVTDSGQRAATWRGAHENIVGLQ